MKKIILITLIYVLTACSPGASSQLQQNRQTWRDAGISHYRFSLTVGCFCAFSQRMPLTVEVQEDQVVSMTYPDGTPVSEADPNFATFSHHATVERIFAELEAGLAGGADKVTVTYDPVRGYPSDIYFDYIKNAADDELSLTISNFEVLK